MVLDKTVLIVDDEEDILTFLQDLFSDEVKNVLTATNGKEGFDLLKENNVDCVISDINMPIMTGDEFIKVAREDQQTVPFVFFTGHGDDKLLSQISEYGVANFLSKPEFGELIDVVTAGLTNGFQPLK